MYGAIKTLDKKGWIQEALDDGESLRKKVYIITELERKIAVQELNRLVYKILLNPFEPQEDWLNKMAEEGWKLVKTSRWGYKFEACQRGAVC